MMAAPYDEELGYNETPVGRDVSQAPLNVQAERLQRLSSHIAGQVTRLLKRLEPVLSPPGPETASESRTPPVISGPLAAQLSETATNFEAVVTLLDHLMSRLEI